MHPSVSDLFPRYSCQVLDRNWVPLLLGWLQLHQRPAVQVEALWALTNLAAGTAEHTNVLIKHGAVPALVDLLSSPNEEVVTNTLSNSRALHKHSVSLTLCLLRIGTCAACHRVICVCACSISHDAHAHLNFPHV